MANYKEIQGFPIQNLTTDPTPYAQALADNPYSGAWASGGAINTARSQISAAGTRDAALVFSGSTPSATAVTESYNGTSWTEVNDLNTARRSGGGFGTQTAAIMVAGFSTTFLSQVESWNGSSWTEIAEVNTARSQLASKNAGSSTAGLIFGGSTDGSTGQALTESWNGSAWTELNDLNTARKTVGGAGTTNTAALAFGGSPSDPTFVANTESWNGTSWTEVNDMNTARRELGGVGSSTSALGFGGNVPPITAATEAWDGTSWTEVNDLSTARSGLGSSGGPNNSDALATSGDAAPGKTTATEEWSFSGLNPATTPAADYSDAIVGQMYYNSTTGQFKAIKDGGVPIGTWASGGTLPRETYASAASGTVSATLLWGGYDDSSYFNDSLEFDGISWGSPVNMNVPATSNRFGVGTQTATIAISGYNTSPAPGVGMPQVESYNGSAWTEIADVNTGVSGHGVAGSPSNAIKYGGTTAMVSPSHPTKTYETKTEQYDGSSWTEVNDLNTGREGLIFANTLPYTAGVAVGGANAPGAVLGIHEQWDGTSWTETADLNTARTTGGGASDGTQTSIIVYGGDNPTPGYLANNEFWNGTSWTEVNDLSAGRYGIGATGASSNNAMAIGNYPSQSNANTWEHFVAADFEINTLTTS